MNKKDYCVVCILLVLGIMIGSIVAGEVQETEKVKPIGSGSMIAMYIQDEDGNYQLSDAQKFPTDGYVLNTEKSSCKNGGVISQNSETKKLSLKVKTSDECTVYFEKERFITLANGLKANLPSVTNYEDGEKTEMYVFDHPEAGQTAGWSEEERRDYRYIGSEPNNYITFNDETWRIIGVFTVETESGNKEQLIKIIRDQSIGIQRWDSNWHNEWSTATLQAILNGDYYNRSGSYSTNGLNSTARSQIAKVKWYLGGSNSWENLGGPDYYNFERGITTCANGCIGDYCCTGETRTTSIVQNVGLIYPSDYIYTYGKGINDKCYTDGYNCRTNQGGAPSAGWLYKSDYQWTISPIAADAYYAFIVNNTGIVDSSSVYDDSREVRPTVFLDSKIAIKSGDGSQGNPYSFG